MQFNELLLSLVLAAHSTQPEAGDPAQLARLRGVADDMVAVGQTSPLFAGEAGSEATSIALYAIARHESGFWAKVQDCSICYPGSAWCDQGRSVSIYQLMRGKASWGDYSREELCSNNRKATERAIAVLSRGAGRSTTQAMFASYAGCSSLRPNCRAGRELEHGFRYALGKARIVVVWRTGGNVASYLR